MLYSYTDCVQFLMLEYNLLKLKAKKEEKQMDENIYERPKSESFPQSKFEFFGGWLRFYQILNVLSIIVLIVALGFLLFLSFTESFSNQNLIDFAMIGLESTPILLLSIFTLKILNKKEGEVPGKVKSYLDYYLSATVVIYVILYISFSKGQITEKPTPLLGDIIYYFIWTSYFKKSKRVKVYYGKNTL